MKERLILIQTYSITLGVRALAPRSSICLGVAKKHWLSPWYVISSTDEQHIKTGTVWERKFWSRLKPKYFEHGSTDCVTATDIRMPWWNSVQQDQLQPHIVEAYCRRFGYSDHFLHEGQWWAFPNNGVVPAPLPKLERRTRQFNIIRAIFKTLEAKWLFYRERQDTPSPSRHDITDIEAICVDFLLLGLPFMLDHALMDRCYKRHGDCYVPEDKLKP